LAGAQITGRFIFQDGFPSLVFACWGAVAGGFGRFGAGGFFFFSLTVSLSVIGDIKSAALENHTDLADQLLGSAARTIRTSVFFLLPDCVLPFKNMSAFFALILVLWH
jgi:hypothetical protein